MTESPLHVVQTLARIDAAEGGPSRSVVYLCDALARRGVTVDLVTSASDAEAVAPAEAGVRVRRAPFPGLASFARRSAFEDAVGGAVAEASSGATIVHDHGLWLPTNAASARAARASGVPFVSSPKGMASAWAMNYRRAKKRVAWLAYQRRALAGAALLQATAESEVDDVRRLGLRLPIALVRHGVAGPPASLQAWPRAAGKRAVFLSRVHPKKGLPLLVEAWARVQPEGWELVIAGRDEGGHRAEVEAQVQAAGLSDAVRFVGDLGDADKWGLLAASDLFVLPTYSENFGIVVAEALVAGVPVLTTHGAPWEVLQTERCGWWTDITVDAIANALQDATSRSDAERQAMGERGRQYADAHLRWDRAADEMIAAYRWVLGQGPRPAFVTDTTPSRRPVGAPAP